MRANQLRPWFASMAYVLMAALRRLALAHTRLDRATCGTIRLALLKIGAQVTRSVRRVRVAMASACPCAYVFALAHARLSRGPRRAHPHTRPRQSANRSAPDTRQPAGRMAAHPRLPNPPR